MYLSRSSYLAWYYWNVYADRLLYRYPCVQQCFFYYQPVVGQNVLPCALAGRVISSRMDTLALARRVAGRAVEDDDRGMTRPDGVAVWDTRETGMAHDHHGVGEGFALGREEVLLLRALTHVPRLDFI